MTYEPVQAHATVAGWGVVTIVVALVLAIVVALVVTMAAPVDWASLSGMQADLPDGGRE